MKNIFKLLPMRKKVGFSLASLLFILLFFEIGIRIVFFQKKSNYVFAISAVYYFISEEYMEYKASKTPNVQGPYKVIAQDFTGDGVIDLTISYYATANSYDKVGKYTSGLFTIEKGDGKGNFVQLGLNTVDVPHRMNHIPRIFNITAGDIDNDGLNDLVVGFESFVSVLKNLGNGKFEEMMLYRTESAAKGVKLADLDNDGILDLLYIARGTARPGDTPSGKLYIRQGLGQWKFGAAILDDAGISAYYIETADFNDDGYLDIFVPNERISTLTYWINPGRDIFNATYSKASQLAANSLLIQNHNIERRVLEISGKLINDVRFADFNGDGHLDLITANWGSNNISLFLGNGKDFQKEQLLPGGENCVFLAIGDLDNDSDLDFVVTHWTDDILSVFLNKGNGEFATMRDYKTGLGNYGVTIFDANADHNLDIITANYKAGSISILNGRGDGTFDNAINVPKGFHKVADRWVPKIRTD